MTGDLQFDGKVILTDGAEIRCVLIEDPQHTPGTPQQLWIEPVRQLADGEVLASIEADFRSELGGAFELLFRWPCQPDGERLPLHVTVVDRATGQIDQDYLT